MFGVGFVFALIGAWLIDCGVQGRQPIKGLEDLVRNPSNYRSSLAQDKGIVSPALAVSTSSAPDSHAATGTAYVAGGGGTPSVTPGNASRVSANNPAASRAIAYALAQVGKPYVYGGTGNNNAQGGYDCSGLIYMAYKSAGVNIPRTTYTMLAGMRNHVSRANLQPGDIVFPSVEHCFMYIGNGQVVEAAHTGTKIHVTNLYAFWQARRP